MKNLAILGALAISVAGTAILAQPYSVDWSTIDGGGAMSSAGGTFSLAGTIGQADAASNPTLTGGTFELTGGFWSVTQTCYCLGDLNHDGLKDGGDIQKFVGCLLAAGDCSCADVDAANGVTLADTDTFVADLLSGGACP